MVRWPSVGGSPFAFFRTMSISVDLSSNLTTCISILLDAISVPLVVFCFWVELTRNCGRHRRPGHQSSMPSLGQQDDDHCFAVPRNRSEWIIRFPTPDRLSRPPGQKGAV